MFIMLMLLLLLIRRRQRCQRGGDGWMVKQEEAEQYIASDT